MLPKSLYCLRGKLGLLQLNDNRIKKVSRDLGNLERLKVLLLHNNPLSMVPASFSQLTEVNEFSLDWFIYLQPPANKILKDERGQMLIKDFQKFSLAVQEIDRRRICTFTLFLAYFHKMQELEQIGAQNPDFPKRRSILHYLCLNGHIHLTKQLLREIPSLDLNIGDMDGTPPVALAIKNHQVKAAEFFMKYPVVDLNKGSQKYGYPLHMAIQAEEFALAIKMLGPKFVINVNARDSEDNNALHFLMGHFSADPDKAQRIAQVLLLKGVNPNHLNKAQWSPLHQALKSFQNKALKFAIDFNFAAAKAGSQRFDFNLQAKDGWTVMHLAVFNSNLLAV
jgi:ankyrin repeat protein